MKCLSCIERGLITAGVFRTHSTARALVESTAQITGAEDVPEIAVRQATGHTDLRALGILARAKEGYIRLRLSLKASQWIINAAQTG